VTVGVQFLDIHLVEPNTPVECKLALFWVLVILEDWREVGDRKL